LSIGGRVYFEVSDTVQAGGEYHRVLWVTDGTSAGTQPLFELPIFPLQSTAPVLSAGASRIFFRGYTTDRGSEPWAYPLEASLCAGDCEGDGVTSTEDLLRAIGRALGDPQPTCSVYGSGAITVDQLV